MDLQDKIAARRRELAAQAEAMERERAVAEQARKVELEREAIEMAKAEALLASAEVERRLKDQGLSSLSTSIVPEKQVEAAIESAITRAASSRWTSGENAMFAVLLIFGLGSFAIAWPLAIFLLVMAGWYASSKTAKYKSQIIAEGLASKLADQSNAPQVGAQND